MRHQLHEPTINALVGTFLQEVKRGNAAFTIQMTHMDDWALDSLHASDLGKCPRETSHRIHGDERRDKTMTELDNEARQFYIANVMHHAFYNAAAWDDRLIDFEIDVTPWMQDGFTGEADAIWENFDDELEVLDVKSLHPNWRTYVKTYPKHHNKMQLMSYYDALKKRNTAMDKRLVRGRMWYTGRGDKTTSLECPIEWHEEEPILRETYGVWLDAVRTDPSELPTLEKVIKKTGGETRLSKIEYAPHWCCEWCDWQGISCVPHDMRANALLYKVGKDWKVSKLGRTMAQRVLDETGVNLDNLNAFDEVETGWMGGDV